MAVNLRTQPREFDKQGPSTWNCSYKSSRARRTKRTLRINKSFPCFQSLFFLCAETMYSILFVTANSGPEETRRVLITPSRTCALGETMQIIRILRDTGLLLRDGDGFYTKAAWELLLLNSADRSTRVVRKQLDQSILVANISHRLAWYILSQQMSWWCYYWWLPETVWCCQSSKKIGASTWANAVKKDGGTWKVKRSTTQPEWMKHGVK